jgi:periplasmic divalent cation tolerance protein
MGEYIVVLCTCPDLEISEKIASYLVENKIAACVNITSPVNSIYFWQGVVERDTEYLLIIKTKKELFEKLEKEIKSLHPYTVPEIIAMPIVLGSKDYLNWIDETVDVD